MNKFLLFFNTRKLAKCAAIKILFTSFAFLRYLGFFLSLVPDPLKQKTDMSIQ